MKKLKYPIKLKCQTPVGALTLSQSLAIPARAAEVPDDELKALIKRIDDLEQEVKTLKQEHEANSQAVAETAKQAAEEAVAKSVKTNAPTVTIGANGLNVRSADNNFNMIIHGYAQADFRTYFGQKS